MATAVGSPLPHPPEPARVGRRPGCSCSRRSRCTRCSSCSRSSRRRATACTTGTGSRPLDRLHRAGQLRARPVRPRVPGRGQPQRVHRRSCRWASRSRSRSGLALMLNRRFRGRAMLRLIFFAPYVIAEVITAIVWSLILQPNGLADNLLTTRRPGGPVPALAGRPGHRPRRPVLHHHVEVLRVPHDPAAGRPPGDPARGRGGRRHRRRVAPAVAALRDPAAARPDDPGLGLPVDHRLAAAVRPHLGHDPRRTR